MWKYYELEDEPGVVEIQLQFYIQLCQQYHRIRPKFKNIAINYAEMHQISNVKYSVNSGRKLLLRKIGIMFNIPHVSFAWEETNNYVELIYINIDIENNQPYCAQLLICNIVAPVSRFITTEVRILIRIDNWMLFFFCVFIIIPYRTAPHSSV